MFVLVVLGKLEFTEGVVRTRASEAVLPLALTAVTMRAYACAAVRPLKVALEDVELEGVTTFVWGVAAIPVVRLVKAVA